MTSTSVRVFCARLVVAAMPALFLVPILKAEVEQKQSVLWKDPGNIAALDLFWGKPPRSASRRVPSRL